MNRVGYHEESRSPVTLAGLWAVIERFDLFE